MPRPNLYRDFLLIYILLTAARAFPRLASKKGARKIIQLLIHRGKDPEILKEALFVVLLPRSCSLWYHWYPDSVLPTILSSPLLQLVEPSLRRTLAVYVATTAATNFGRDSTHRRHLPPTWTLILIANSWLLWAFLFQRECFPHRYGDLILRHSGYGSGEPTENLVHFLQQTKFEIYPPGVLSSTSSTEIQIHPAHTRAVCARLHPTTPSCLRTYVKAWLTQFPQVFKWVGVFSGLSLLLRKPKLSQRPHDVLKDWLISSTRGTAFIVGTINTCWGLTCFFQYILRPGSLSHFRWIANGLLGNFWILILPTRRRTEFALYCTRLALGSYWNLFNERSPKYGEAIVFALSWASLQRDWDNGNGPYGLAGMVLNYIDRHKYKRV